MNKAKRWWAVILGLVGVTGAVQVQAEPSAESQSSVQQPNEAELKTLLAERTRGGEVRSHHAAIDRLLTSEDPAAEGGHDKTTFDKEYDKEYNREKYTKTYEKGT